MHPGMPAPIEPVRLVPVIPTDANDVQAIVAFVNAHYKSELPLDAIDVENGHYVFFWAFRGDVRVGCSAWVKKTRWLAETVKTVVDPARRGKGVGAAISQAIEDAARDAGFAKVMTTILVNNIPMIIIKLRQGYLIEGIHRDHEKPGLHEYSLGKVFADHPPGTR